MMQRKHVSLAMITLLGSLSTSLKADIDVYGQLHLSGDWIDNASIADTTMTSNASHLGFKGEHPLNYGFTAMWTLESNIDVAGEREWLTARNRFIGLKHEYGTLIAGYHDTPMKTLGESIDMWSETMADRRNIIGSGDGTSSDIRARNSAMYISPTLYGMEWRMMASVGGDNDPNMDSQYMLSSSLIYNHEYAFIGFSGERQKQTELARDHARAITGVRYAGAKLNVFYEYMKSNSIDEFSRQGYGSSASYTLYDTSLKMQAFYADNNDARANSDALSFSVGLSQTFSKNLEMYLLYAQTINGANAAYSLGAGEHGDTYYGDMAGDDLMGVSAGISYRF